MKEYKPVKILGKNKRFVGLTLKYSTLDSKTLDENPTWKDTNECLFEIFLKA
jgi:hypothetical protein